MIVKFNLPASQKRKQRVTKTNRGTGMTENHFDHFCKIDKHNEVYRHESWIGRKNTKAIQVEFEDIQSRRNFHKKNSKRFRYKGNAKTIGLVCSKAMTNLGSGF